MRHNRLQKLSFLILLITAGSMGCGNTSQSSQSSVPTTAGSPSSAPSPKSSVTGEELVEDPLDVPYVPTPTEVVTRMLRIANVNEKDLLYDLGSGDGRIVISAAKDHGARGVGYDLNPQRIKESNENARKAGVTKRVRFVQKDLFEADLTGATVVTLYLLPDVNLRLRPKLLGELRPGTRVVSHNYHMGDWQAESVEEVTVKGVKHYIYYWKVPPEGKINE